MPLPIAVPLAISGISALAGLFSNRSRTQQQQSTQNIDQTQMPEYDPQTLALRNFLMNQLSDRVRFNDDYFSGYRAEGLGNLNRTGNATAANIENILASRGLSRTTAGSTAALMNQLSRLNQQGSFLNSIPMLADERSRNNLADLGGFFARLPVGQRQTGTTTSSGTSTIPGNMMGGMFTGLGNALAGLYGEGAFGGPPANRPRYYGYPTMPNPAPNPTPNLYDTRVQQTIAPLFRGIF